MITIIGKLNKNSTLVIHKNSRYILKPHLVVLR